MDYTQSGESHIVPVDGPVIEYGVHFVYEGRIKNFGYTDHAKERAELVVRDWADTQYPAKLMQREVSPWTEVK